MANLPYITSPGNIGRALTEIQSAATPPKVSQDFVKTILKIRGGSGNQVASFLKKIGFTGPDGSPTDLYRQFRNPDTRGAAAAKSLRTGYAPLYTRNEYMLSLSDEKLRGLIIEETGHSDGSNVVSLVLASIKAIKKFADSSPIAAHPEAPEKMTLARAAAATGDEGSEHFRARAPNRLGLNLAYTINLNLPATPDVAVFNAIFKSLKENLLREENE